MISNNPQTLSFQAYLANKIGVIRFAIPAVISALVALSIGLIYFIQYSNSNQSFAEAIAPHISTLIETQDHPELQRFIGSISGKRGIDIEVLDRNQIIASTLGPTRIGLIETLEKNGPLPFSVSYFSHGSLLNLAQVKRNGGPANLDAKVVLYGPVQSLLYFVLGITISAFLVSMLVVAFAMSRIFEMANKALGPLRELDEAIKGLQDENEKAIPQFPIIELENIRSTLIFTRSQLRESNDKLVKSKAKELASNAYRNLIHDLHVPVSALRNHLKIIALDRTTSSEKENARIRMGELAEQILRQIKAAKSHLALEVSLREGEDIRECVSKAAGQAQLASYERPNIDFQEIMPVKKVVKAHDPIMLGRAVSNLVTNAIEACNKTVEIKIEERNQEVIISVSDDGKGVSQEAASLYLQGRGKSSKADRMGIGLSSANHIVRSHGGKLIYRASPLGGACFEIRI